ncbi:hypothetical protein BS50DRAFT_292539 [Corynespora cassiicola Philippines]|uniref:Transcription initiation factor TFIID subunit 2 n=1 Tax=Corynespora cassiicola Philippines TaxID=1448308 RepID=A0A2T2NW61_CORCC|nr:hypothetical protein BS50DRAFT_292539 [Corynespora cassiicola Philippines]
MEDGLDEGSATAFTVLKQKLELDINFAPRLVKGKTTIDIQPQSADLRWIHFNARQIKPTSIKVAGRTATFNYSDLYQRVNLRPGTGIEQFHFPKNRLQRHAQGTEDELVINVPDNVRIRELQPEDDAEAAAAGFSTLGEGKYAPLKVEIEYVLENFRDGLHFAGLEDGDNRYPHAYTRNPPFPGAASCLFPCIDDGNTKCIFEVSVRYPRTLGDALCKAPAPAPDADVQTQPNGVPKADSVMSDAEDDPLDLTEEEKAIEMSVVCSGELTDDIPDPTNASRKTASFFVSVPVLPQHIGIVIGPFQHVDLSEYRDMSDDERLGSNAIRVHAFCLPGREDEVRNSAMMLAKTLDSFTERYQSYPFEKAYKLAFVDDLDCDTTHTASFSICSSRLLFPENIWEPLESTTRALIHAVASQWIGVNVTAANSSAHWIIVGGSWFMTEWYLRDLFGRNDHRYRQKEMMDKVMQMDNRRPSLCDLGEYLTLDPAEREFMELKAVLVLSILHNRLLKQSGKNGVDRCLYRLLFNARNEKLPNAAITTESFLDICEKVGHQKLDTFFNQWVSGAGCPTFECFPLFNKKKQVIQLTIRQTQGDPSITKEERSLAAEDFMREAKEKAHGFRPTSEWPAFVGPMTIRIHEADGTPYEHIVDINSSNVKVEIPYNTKYKRLKRNKREKERVAAAQGLDASGETQEDVTFYSLGDLFQSNEEIDEWRISDWSPEDEQKMENEAYEWIRVDADFEWICRANINDMPSYMYVSQLQQDKDVVAQCESIQYLAGKEGHKLISSILTKTLMDPRYFWKIRALAADVISQSAKPSCDMVGLFHLRKAWSELFCTPGSSMTRSNDFSDRSSYMIQKAIPKAISRIRGPDGKAPMEVKGFLLDVIRYNDNRGNDFSDDYYLATLMRCLSDCLASNRQDLVQNRTMSIMDEMDEMEFTKKALEELGRHQRLDEWIPTYQNIYTTTAMECATKLMIVGVQSLEASEFLQYTRIGNSDIVRIKAWESLIRLGTFQKPSVLKYFFHDLQSDPSPYYRAQLLRVLDLAIGQIAVGDVFVPAAPKDAAMGGLVIEREVSQTDRESELARRKLDGALRGLKTDLAANETLKKALEQALRSTTLSASDIAELLGFASFFVVSKNELHVHRKLPRFWKAQHVGNGRLRFFQGGRIRTLPFRPPQSLGRKQSVAQPTPAPQPPQPLQAPQAPQAPPKPPQAPPAPLATPFGGMKVKLQLKTKTVATPPSSASPMNTASGAAAQRTPSGSAPPSAKERPPASGLVIKKESTPAPASKPMSPAGFPVKKTHTPTSASPLPRSTPVATPVATPKASPAPTSAPAPTSKDATTHKMSVSKPSVSKSAAPPNAAPPRPAASGGPTIKIKPPKHRLGPEQPGREPSQNKEGKKIKIKNSSNKKSRIVKLRLPPHKLAAVASRTPKPRPAVSFKKRKAEDDGNRPIKRQSTDPSMRNGVKNPKVKVERTNDTPPRLLLKLRVGRQNLPGMKQK